MTDQQPRPAMTFREAREAGLLTYPAPVADPAPVTSRPLRTLDEYLASARRLSPDTLRQHLADMYRVRDAQAEQLRRNGTLLCRLRDLDELRDRAWAEHDTAGDAAPDNDEQDRPECTALCRDVEDERDRLAATLDRADSARIDRHDRIWRPAPGGWARHPYGTLTDQTHTELHGPARTVLLVPLGDSDEQHDEQAEQDPTVAERLTTTAHAAQDVADVLERTEGERDRLRSELARTCEQLAQARAALGSPPARVQDPHVQSAARELLQHLRATEPRPATTEG